MRRNVPQGGNVSIPVAIQVSSDDPVGLPLEAHGGLFGKNPASRVPKDPEAGAPGRAFLAAQGQVKIAVGIEVRRRQINWAEEPRWKILGSRKSPLAIVPEKE